jgi:hypothetical protein
VDATDQNDGAMNRASSKGNPYLVINDEENTADIEVAPDGYGVANACLDPRSMCLLTYGGRQVSLWE